MDKVRRSCYFSDVSRSLATFEEAKDGGDHEKDADHSINKLHL